MDDKEKKKKESIDEILSDLNGLLNKMPSILDGIKLPNLKSAEFRPPVEENSVPATPSGPAFEVPRPIDVPPAGAFDKTVKIDADAYVLPDSIIEPEPSRPQIEPVSTPDMPVADMENALKQEEASLDEAFKLEEQPKLKEAPFSNPLEQTKDFGVPDIDTLLNMSDIPSQAKPVEPLPAAEPAPSEPEPEVKPEAAPEPAGLENLVITPSDPPEPSQEKIMEFKEEDLKGIEEQISIQAVTEPAPVQAEETLSIQSPQLEPVVEAASPVEPAPEPVIEQQPAATAASEEVPGLVIEQTARAFAEPAPATPAEEKTVVITPGAAPMAEEKTVIYEAGAMHKASHSAGDLNGLAAKQRPEGIPDERVRNVAFVYSPDDAALCADVLAEIDSICSRSETKPMFVNRAFVQECGAEAKGNYLLQMVNDSKAIGLVCVGNVPHEHVYELENVFGSSGILFKHLSAENYGHSAALDTVMEFILR